MDDHFYDEEDLVTANTEDRNWKGIIIAVMVICTVLALIVTSVILLTPPDEGPRVRGRRFELEDIFSPKFQPLRSNGTWVSDTDWIYWDTSGGVSILTVAGNSLTTRPLISNYTFRRFNAKLSGISADLKYALLVHDVQQVHRHSTLAQYTLFHIETGEMKPLSIENNLSEGAEVKHSTLQLVKWSPIGSSLIIVHEGDIYYKPDPKNRTVHRLTKSAVPGVVYNGIADWLYEEEILGSNVALWFSNDAQNLLYLSFNDSLVGEHTLLQYGAPEDPYLYPQVRRLRYPKPGTTNPTVTAHVVELRQSRAFREQELRPPEGISDMEYYVTAGGWVKSTEVGIIWTSRSYNLSIISVCSTKDGNCEELYRFGSDLRGWVDTIPMPFFTSDPGSRNFITIAPIRDGENGFFDHLVLVDTVNKRSHPITHGSMDVIKINAWDEERKLIYFIGVEASSPKERHLYRLRVEQPYTEHNPDCLTCVPEALLQTPAQLRDGNRTMGNNGTFTATKERMKKKMVKSNKDASTRNFAGNDGSGGRESLDEMLDTFPTSTTSGGQQGAGAPRQDAIKSVGGDAQRNTLVGSNKSCSFVTSVKFSLGKSFFTLECGGPDIPYVGLYSSNPSNMGLIQILQNNDALRNLSDGMAFPQVKVFNMELNGGHAVQIKLQFPPGLREDEITKYPLVLNVYGGPGTQLALDRWGVDFATYLASKKDYIVAQIDSRGSGGRGWDYQHKVYYRVGILEAEDQIEVIRKLRESLHFIEEKKIGVWGWSYGGYLTAMIMASKDSTDLFQCGASVAPVTNWKLYDSAYTERYMGRPNLTENYKGYAESDVTQNVDNFENKMFYLLHGTADDNVHIQHSMLLAKALIAKKILFRQQIYPDETHSLKGVQMHVHRSLEEFFEDCFRKQIDPELTGLNQGGAFDEGEKK